MKPTQRLTTEDLRKFSDDELKHLQSATSRLANETQRQAAHYSRESDKLRREIKRREGKL